MSAVPQVETYVSPTKKGIQSNNSRSVVVAMVVYRIFSVYQPQDSGVQTCWQSFCGVCSFWYIVSMNVRPFVLSLEFVAAGCKPLT